MRFLRFSRSKERDPVIPAVSEAERILENPKQSFLIEALVLRTSVEVLRDFLNDYPLTKEEGPEGIHVIVRDKLNDVLQSSASPFIRLSLRTEEFVLFLNIRLGYADCDEETMLKKGYTRDVEESFEEVVRAFTGEEGL